jgi:hypothetical protein
MEKPSKKRLASLEDNGRIAVLGDGSAWLVNPDDRKKVSRWKIGVRVTVSLAGMPESILTNADISQDVRAAYAGQR